MRYLWKDTRTKIEVEVTRKMADSSEVPDKPEALEAGMEVEDYAQAIWEKIITGGIGTITWGGKGKW